MLVQLQIREDIRAWEALIKQARAKGENAEDATNVLAATLGDLANALKDVGELERAMETANRSLAIDRELGNFRGVAGGLGRIAQILMEQGRFREADTRYEEALQAAHRAGDRDLEGALLQNQGALAYQMQQYKRAAKLLTQALHRYREMNDEGQVVHTYNLLGLVEQGAGRLAEARDWYERSRQVARDRQDIKSLANAAHNIGTVCQQEGEAARARGDEALAKERFAQGVCSIHESLKLREELQDKPGQATSHGQLAVIHLLLGEFGHSEEHAHQAREMFESLGLKDVHIAYWSLAWIARARGDTTQAAEWEAKRNAVLAELERRARGGGGLDS